MSHLQELASIIDGLDTEGPNYQDIRAAKRLIHDLIKAEEARS